MTGGVTRICTHFDRKATVQPLSEGCGTCVASGDKWKNLRLCLTCGAVGCCDDSANRHASRHAKEAGHPVIRSLVPGEDWAWCFKDETYV